MTGLKKILILGISVFTVALASAQVSPTPDNITIDVKGGGKDGAKTVEDIKGMIDERNNGKEPVDKTGKEPKETKENKENKDDKTKTKKGKGLKEDEDLSLNEDALIVNSRQALPLAKIYGQQFFRDKSISLFTKVAKVEAMDSYILDVGDELSVSIWGDAVYSGVFDVTKEGFVDFSQEFESGGVSVPRLYLKGVEFGKARDLIKSQLGKYINLSGPRTQIKIVLNYARNITINITGEVFTPGSYTIPATNTAFNALVAASGPSQIGSVRDIKVFSNSKPPRVLDLYKYLQNPEPKQEFFLANNDYIFVPLAGRVVKIDGAIKRPFYYELIKDENLIDLIEYSGGLQPDAYKTNVQVKRYINDEEILIDVSLEKLIKEKSDFELLDGDEVMIAPIEQSYTNYVTIQGAIRIPGEYELTPGKTRLSEILGKAGLLGSARMDRIYVIRVKEDLSKEYIRLNLDNLIKDPNSNENIVLRPYDQIRIDPKSRFRNDYSIEIFGAVREPGQQTYSPNLTLKDVIFLSGGLQEQAANNRIEISRIVRGTNENTRVIVNTVEIDDDLSIQNDYLLEPFDQVFVRTAPEFELQRNVEIRGEVRYPGIYSLIDKNERILSLIQRAGGATDGAFLEGAVMYREDGNAGFVLLDAKQVVDDPNSNFNYILKNKDVITIPKIRDLVTIKGAVNFPAIDSSLIPQINVPYHAGKSAKFYVNEYGAGINKDKRARWSLVYVTLPNGQVHKSHNYVLFKTFPKVEKGSVVTVQTKPAKKKKERTGERKPVEWDRILPAVIGQVTGILTIFFLIKNLN